MIVAVDDYESVCEALSYERVLSIDTETYGLRLYKEHRLFSIIIATREKEFYFNFKDYPNPIPKLESFEPLKKVLLQPETVFYMANAKFDLRALEKEGLEVAGEVRDVLVLARLENNVHLEYSLASCAAREGFQKDDAVEKFLSENHLWEWEEIPGKEKRSKHYFFDKVPPDLIVPYGEKDARITFDLGELLYDKLKKRDETLPPNKPKICQVAENEFKLTKTCYAMERVGIKIDKEFCEASFNREKGNCEKAARRFEEISGHPFTDSNKSLSQAFKAVGITGGTTEKGNPSFTDAVLATKEHPLAQAVRDYREAYKKASTYYQSFLYHAGEEKILHANIRQAGTTTGRFAYSDPNCLWEDTEVLTKEGWKKGVRVTKEDLVACFCVDKKRLFWRSPSKVFVSREKEIELVKIKNQHMDIWMTPEHRCLFRDRRTGVLSERLATSFLKDAHILHGAPLVCGQHLVEPDLLRLLVAIQADGHYTNGHQIIFSFQKERKRKRLESICQSLGIPIKFGAGKRYTAAISRIHTQFLKDKKWTWEVLNLSQNLRGILLEELRYWDGLVTRKETTYCSKHESNVDILQAVAASLGIRAHKSQHSAKHGVYWNLFFTTRDYSLTCNHNFKVEKEFGRVWCLEVPTGFFLARRGMNTFITGNCQNIPKEEGEKEFKVRNAFIPREGFCFVEFDFQAMEYRLMVDYAGETSLIEKIKAGLDVHEATGQMMGVPRSTAKTLNFMLLYSGGAQKLADSLRISLPEAKVLKAQYFSALPRVREFIHAVTRTAEQRGFIFNWFGRRLNFPDKDFSYKAPNALIQGGCADIVKLGMNRVHDFLLDKKSRMILQVHDSILLEVDLNEFSILPEIKEILETAYPTKTLKMEVNCEYSFKSWGTLEKGMPS